MANTIRVTPEDLIASAEQFSASAGTVQNLTNNMIATVDSMSSVWTGEAATAFNTKVHGLQDSINKMVRKINEHSTDLRDMAINYQNAEKTAQESAQALKTDIIV